ncbi:MAG: hypothetical protein OES09_12800 [Gammaproteobacteria bacterium]|nr:hypothetical protein [Gammaproteobacteria bacterium]
MQQTGTRIRLLPLAGMVSLFLVSVLANAENSLSIKTNAAVITVSMPVGIKIGEPGPVEVMVQPTEGATAPKTVRARVGMPRHGHWIGEEGSHAFTPASLEFVADKCSEPATPVSGVMCLPEWFDSLFPMEGQYRIRVWLDYADGHTVTSAVDLDLESGKPIELVEYQTAATTASEGASHNSGHESHEAHDAKHKH